MAFLFFVTVDLSSEELPLGLVFLPVVFVLGIGLRNIDWVAARTNAFYEVMFRRVIY